MAQVGNAENSKLNGEWGKHVRKRLKMKRQTSKIRRMIGKKIIKETIQN